MKTGIVFLILIGLVFFSVGLFVIQLDYQIGISFLIFGTTFTTLAVIDHYRLAKPLKRL